MLLYLYTVQVSNQQFDLSVVVAAAVVAVFAVVAVPAVAVSCREISTRLHAFSTS